MNPVTRPTVRLWAVLLMLWAVALCHTALAQATPPAVIDAGAKLHITVANEAQLTGDYTVDSAGNITLLYINQVFVQGLTPAQAAAAIRGNAATGGKAATGLSQFYVSPQVVVTITDAGGIGVDVAGLVSAPRHYTVRSNAHLDDVLQQAVPALNADLTKVEITRGDTKAKETVDYRSYLDNKSPAGNPFLRSGDVIVIANRDPLPITINVQGQVVKPGRFQVPPNTSAYGALQAAGGPTLAANHGRDRHQALRGHRDRPLPVCAGRPEPHRRRPEPAPFGRRHHHRAGRPDHGHLHHHRAGHPQPRRVPAAQRPADLARCRHRQGRRPVRAGQDQRGPDHPLGPQEPAPPRPSSSTPRTPPSRAATSSSRATTSPSARAAPLRALTPSRCWGWPSPSSASCTTRAAQERGRHGLNPWRPLFLAASYEALSYLSRTASVGIQPRRPSCMVTA